MSLAGLGDRDAFLMHYGDSTACTYALLSSGLFCVTPLHVGQLVLAILDGLLLELDLLKEVVCFLLLNRMMSGSALFLVPRR